MQKYINCLRAKHYIKNILILIPAIFSKKLLDITALPDIAWGILSFCALSSVIYIFNDLCDMPHDQKHPTKQNRPIASGAISPKAAIVIMEQYDGRMPDTWELLQNLPGIGSYTAGAIASIAYGRCVPAVDGNVLRVLSRLRMDDAFITQQAVKKRVEEELLAVMPKDRPGDFNQALMELGATVCIPNGEPRCGECPWKELCRARANGCTDAYPKKEKKKGRKIEPKTVLILKHKEEVAIHKRPDKGLLAGLYELPNLEGHLSEEEVVGTLRDKGLSPIRIERLPDAKHVFSHKEWHMVAYAVRIDELLEKGIDTEEDYLFIHPKETEERYPIPSAFFAYTEYLNIKLGNEKFEKRGN